MRDVARDADGIIPITQSVVLKICHRPTTQAKPPASGFRLLGR